MRYENSILKKKRYAFLPSVNLDFSVTEAKISRSNVFFIHHCRLFLVLHIFLKTGTKRLDWKKTRK